MSFLPKAEVSCTVVSDSAIPWTAAWSLSSVHGILQARVLKWVAISFSRTFPFHISIHTSIGLPGGSDSKESACNAEDPGSMLGGEDPLEK